MSSKVVSFMKKKKEKKKKNRIKQTDPAEVSLH